MSLAGIVISATLDSLDWGDNRVRLRSGPGSCLIVAAWKRPAHRLDQTMRQRTGALPVETVPYDDL